MSENVPKDEKTTTTTKLSNVKIGEILQPYPYSCIFLYHISFIYSR